MNKINNLKILLLLSILSSCATHTKKVNTHGEIAVILPAQELKWKTAFDGFPIEFAPTNGVIFETEHGNFGKFPGGQNFITPEHTHSHSYQAVVISGTMINPIGDEDPKNAKRMGPGSYWYVPANQAHTTGCVSEEPCVFYSYQSAGFDFTPTKK
ncbi:DUF4437 domain-containing protein [Flavobacterium columnare]|uniref:DUF4437 domain-containing protein n=1 Tax=Flavobacterium columnare TaxID=996 RepID=UPI00177FF4DC|nr:DUF4437 domain-containing protein [Flavobacterium columnare]MEB3799822.1 DUF4437 domain-containing protein [Flavobacterium columnare]QOG90435.1 DUF4437 domain-containing protein [Flavobacterium columnare]QOG93091.1 DUF4437 domain-containing protein [Flavobacterium columnare]QOG95756.1 DUF4437 domain-containing protein [Flavobacterium columnare]QOG98416.1 DUF4437 domain-containing protein [Flavobacterium columnare]